MISDSSQLATQVELQKLEFAYQNLDRKLITFIKRGKLPKGQKIVKGSKKVLTQKAETAKKPKRPKSAQTQ